MYLVKQVTAKPILSGKEFFKQLRNWNIFSNFLQALRSNYNRKLFSCLFWFWNFSLLKSKMSWWWDHQSIIWRNRLIAKLKDGFCQGRSDHLSKKKSNTLMIIMPLRQLLHRKAQKTSHCFIAYRNLKNGQKYVSMIKSRN